MYTNSPSLPLFTTKKLYPETRWRLSYVIGGTLWWLTFTIKEDWYWTYDLSTTNDRYDPMDNTVGYLSNETWAGNFFRVIWNLVRIARYSSSLLSPSANPDIMATSKVAAHIKTMDERPWAPSIAYQSTMTFPAAAPARDIRDFNIECMTNPTDDAFLNWPKWLGIHHKDYVMDSSSVGVTYVIDEDTEEEYYSLGITSSTLNDVGDPYATSTNLCLPYVFVPYNHSFLREHYSSTITAATHSPYTHRVSVKKWSAQKEVTIWNFPYIHATQFTDDFKNNMAYSSLFADRYKVIDVYPYQDYSEFVATNELERTKEERINEAPYNRYSEMLWWATWESLVRDHRDYIADYRDSGLKVFYPTGHMFGEFPSYYEGGQPLRSRYEMINTYEFSLTDPKILSSPYEAGSDVSNRQLWELQFEAFHTSETQTVRFGNSERWENAPRYTNYMGNDIEYNLSIWENYDADLNPAS